MASPSDYSNICFVIAPFGRKRLELVRRRQGAGKSTTVTKIVDFDAIYDGVFEPAINAVELPEGGRLTAHRADRDFFTGNIGTAMFRYIEYSRFAVADITGLNANVFMELGHRYRARESGTAVFRLPNAPVPFDISQIRAFSYDYRPDIRARESRALITKVLTESLVHNHLDSPIQEALNLQWRGGRPIESVLLEAENAVRAQNWTSAREHYELASSLQPSNALLHFRVGAMLRLAGDWATSSRAFDTAVQLSPDYAEAHRELGIAQNKLYQKNGGVGLDGLDALRRAVALNMDDFDALSSLGGALRRKGMLHESLEMYRRATVASHGHAYPLLNELKLEIAVNGKFDIFHDRRLQLRRAELFRLGQVSQTPPIDSPWSFFDLAEVHLYLGKPSEFVRVLEEGLVQPLTRAWHAQTFRETLDFLLDSLKRNRAPVPSGLERGISILRDAEQQLPV